MAPMDDYYSDPVVEFPPDVVDEFCGDCPYADDDGTCNYPGLGCVRWKEE